MVRVPFGGLSAHDIARSLDAKRVGSGWAARCPGHHDRTPSLSIHEGQGGRVLFHCHAGCSQDEVIEALRCCGVWPERRGRSERSQPDQPLENTGCVKADGNARVEQALRIWDTSHPAEGTQVEAYLRSRGMTLLVPPSLRMRVLKHRSGMIYPTMVALVTAGITDEPVAIHRTFLDWDGSSNAPVEPRKMMLGPCRGGAVRLAPASDLVMIGEGIETCLAAMQATGHPAWAALSTSGLRALDLPGCVRDVIVLADGDDPGEAAACDCARGWKREGRQVRIARPPRGMDFNDLLKCRTSCIEEDA